MLVADLPKQASHLIMQRKTSMFNFSFEQQQTILKWCNVHLKTKGFHVEKLADLRDGICIVTLLEILTGRNFYDIENEVIGKVTARMRNGRHNDERNGENNMSKWRIIENIFFQDQDMDILHKFQESDVFRQDEVNLIITQVLWRIMLQYQILHNPLAMDSDASAEFKQASGVLMNWVKTRLHDNEISNWTTDWSSGIRLCKLINSISPGTISKSMMLESNDPVKLACSVAQEVLSIPEITSSEDMANGNVDEKSMMAYISLFKNADDINARGVSSKLRHSFQSICADESMNTAVNETQHCNPLNFYSRPGHVAFGSGLRWAQVGKTAEFIVKTIGTEYERNSLSISIKCAPYDVRLVYYKPDLQIKPIDKQTYRIRYTPTRPGGYFVNVLCNNTHIANSPFRLDITETVLMPASVERKEIVLGLHSEDIFSISDVDDFPSMKTGALLSSYDSSRHDSAFVDDDSIEIPSDLDTPPPWLDTELHDLFTDLTKSGTLKIQKQHSPIKVFGDGIHYGVVGNVSLFYVHTPNTSMGPLGVNITCPAISIPVPYVKSKLHLDYFSHEVAYVPTEPGSYQIIITWEEKELPGSPFYFLVDCEADDTSKELHIENPNMMIEYRNGRKHDIFVYYSATSKNCTCHKQKDELVNLLKKNRPFDQVFLIAIDIELSRKEREDLYKLAGTSKLPLVFASNSFFGTYDDVIIMYQKQGPAESLGALFRVGSETFKSRLERLSSSGSSNDSGLMFSTEV